MATDLTAVHDLVVDALQSFPLRDSYPDEQRDLQPHLQEVEYIRPRLSASKSFAETFGQSLVYCLRYPQVIAFLLHESQWRPARSP